jgi:hypothetical protein
MINIFKAARRAFNISELPCLWTVGHFDSEYKIFVYSIQLYRSEYYYVNIYQGYVMNTSFKKLFMTGLTALSFMTTAIAGEGFFTQRDLAEVELSATIHYRAVNKLRVNQVVYGDYDRDGSYVQYLVLGFKKNNVIAKSLNSGDVYEFRRNALALTKGYLVGKEVLADRDNDGSYVEYVIRGVLPGQKVIVEKHGTSNNFYKVNMSDIAISVYGNEIVYGDLDRDGTFVQYSIRGIFPSGNLMVSKPDSNISKKVKSSDVGYTYSFFVGETVYGDHDNDGRYAEYVVVGVKPNGVVIAKNKGNGNIYSFLPESMGYESYELAYNSYRNLSDLIYNLIDNL